jgi:Kdo-III transferase WaaZ
MPEVMTATKRLQPEELCFPPFALLAAWLDQRSSHPRIRRWSRKIYRLGYSREFKHMTHAGARFSVGNPGKTSERRIILWDRKVVAETQPLEDVRNSEVGIAFILATGPSIKEQRIHLLRGQKIIGVNGAMAVLRELQLTPSHYVITDDDFAINRFELVREAIQSGTKCFFACSVLAAICERDMRLLRHSNIYLVEPVNQLFGVPRLPGPRFLEWARTRSQVVLPQPPNPQVDRIGFSRDLTLGLFTACTVTFAALQVAYHIGFRRIAILGMDLNYSGPIPRAYETTGQVRPSQVAEQYEPVIKPCFEVARDLCSAGELEVLNLSPKTRLPSSIIPHARLEDVLSTLNEARVVL